MSASNKKTLPTRILSVLTAGILIVLALVAAPAQALAREYSIPQVTIEATVNKDGSLEVVEDRTYDFNGSFNGVYWDIPTLTEHGDELGVTIENAGMVEGGRFTEFEETYSGDDRTWKHTSTHNDATYVERVTLYCKQTDSRPTYRLIYRVDAAIQAHEDCAELYWKFVSDGWDRPSENVRCTIFLPVPRGEEVVAGENVLLWAHGPLNGQINAVDDDIVITVPEVGTEEYAEARITFPVEWVPDAENDGRNALSGIVAEENRWSRNTNLLRWLFRGVIALACLVPGVLAAITIITIVQTRRRYNETHTPVFQDEYFRDVPSDDHPAVLGVLYHEGDPEDSDFAASLMRLTDIHAVGLDVITTVRKTLLGEKETEDYCLIYNPAVGETVEDPVDKASLRFLFENVAPKVNGFEEPADGRVRLAFSGMEEVADDYAERYNDYLESWGSVITREAERRGFYDDTSGVLSNRMVGLSIGCIVVAIAGGIAAIVLGSIPVGVFAMVSLAVGIAGLVVDSGLDPLSQEAVEIRAKLEALKKWLSEFTNLGEAIPQDVVLWNRLLVMAVVLGVADRVIDQLGVAYPQIFEDDGFVSTYGWYYVHAGHDSAISEFQRSYASAAHVSAAEIASSDSSSGGGGGFSSGGGGGFGGGGGGGAF